jgi:hypothetical protein
MRSTVIVRLPRRWMMRPHVSRILLAAIAVSMVLPATAGAKGLSKQQVKELESGSVVMVKLDEDGGKGFIGGSSYALLKEDIDKAWNAIQDAKLYAMIYPTTMESKEVYKKGNNSLVKMVQGNKLAKATYYLDYTAEPDQRKLSWKMNQKKPHDINDSRGVIQFTEYKDGRTFMKMTCVVDLGNDVIEKMFGDKIAMGLLRLPMKFRKFLMKPAADKYAPK